MNQNNNYNFDPMTGQPIQQSVQQPIQETNNNFNNQEIQTIQPKKKQENYFYNCYISYSCNCSRNLVGC